MGPDRSVEADGGIQVVDVDDVDDADGVCRGRWNEWKRSRLVPEFMGSVHATEAVDVDGVDDVDDVDGVDGVDGISCCRLESSNARVRHSLFCAIGPRHAVHRHCPDHVSRGLSGAARRLADRHGVA